MIRLDISYLQLFGYTVWMYSAIYYIVDFYIKQQIKLLVIVILINLNYFKILAYIDILKYILP